MKTNYGTALDSLIVNYKEMLTLIVQARIGNERVDEWKKALDLVENPEQVRSKDYFKTKVINCQDIIDGTFKYDKIDYEKYV